MSTNVLFLYWFCHCVPGLSPNHDILYFSQKQDLCSLCHNIFPFNKVLSRLEPCIAVEFVSAYFAGSQVAGLEESPKS